MKEGQLTRRGPTAWQQKDIEFGWKMAKEMGRLDIGQSVAVKDQAVLAVEAVEGTDECIRRAGALCRAGGFTVVKVAKPQQDMRFDVPTIGLGTLETLHAAGGKVLAVEAGRTIFLDQAAVIDFANRNGLVIVAVSEPGQMPAAPSSLKASPWQRIFNTGEFILLPAIIGLFAVASVEECLETGLGRAGGCAAMLSRVLCPLPVLKEPNRTEARTCFRELVPNRGPRNLSCADRRGAAMCWSAAFAPAGRPGFDAACVR